MAAKGTRERTTAEIDAGRLLGRYFKIVYEKAGLKWVPDNTYEIEGIVTLIADAAYDAAQQAVGDVVRKLGEK